jgi:hypothetical protein
VIINKMMIRKLFKPSFSKRESMIIKECCEQSFKVLNKQQSLSPDIMQIKDDILEIIKKLEKQYE